MSEALFPYADCNDEPGVIPDGNQFEPSPHQPVVRFWCEDCKNDTLKLQIMHGSGWSYLKWVFTETYIGAMAQVR
jgi:hypothetical protein